MTVDANRGSTVSRSIRLHQDTIEKLEQIAKDKEVGVTVLMRDIIDAYVNTPAPILHIGEPYELQDHFVYPDDTDGSWGNE